MIVFSHLQSFISQYKRKEVDDEDISKSFIQKHEQKIRYFGKYVASNILQFNLLQNLCRSIYFFHYYYFYAKWMLTNETASKESIQILVSQDRRCGIVTNNHFKVKETVNRRSLLVPMISENLSQHRTEKVFQVMKIKILATFSDVPWEMIGDAIPACKNAWDCLYLPPINSWGFAVC